MDLNYNTYHGNNSFMQFIFDPLNSVNMTTDYKASTIAGWL